MASACPHISAGTQGMTDFLSTGCILLTSWSMEGVNGLLNEKDLLLRGFQSHSVLLRVQSTCYRLYCERVLGTPGQPGSHRYTALPDSLPLRPCCTCTHTHTPESALLQPLTSDVHGRGYGSPAGSPLHLCFSLPPFNNRKDLCI